MRKGIPEMPSFTFRKARCILSLLAKRGDAVAIDPTLTAAFQGQPRPFMKNHVMAVIGLQINEKMLNDAGKEVKRPTFPVMPSARVPAVPDTESRAERNYALKQPIVLAGGIERITQIKGHHPGTPLSALRISPLNAGAPPAGMFPVYYLPYANN